MVEIMIKSLKQWFITDKMMPIINWRHKLSPLGIVFIIPFVLMVTLIWIIVTGILRIIITFIIIWFLWAAILFQKDPEYTYLQGLKDTWEAIPTILD